MVLDAAFVQAIVEQYGLVGVFVAAALSDSIIPIPAWPAIGLAAGFLNPVLVFIFAFTGSLLGMITNYFIGLKGIHNFIARRNPKAEKKAQKWFHKYGVYALLFLTWIPIIGDPLTIAAGALEMPFKKFLFYISLAKAWTITVIIVIGYYSISFAQNFINLG
jgi:membrane protein YqaA with SNARE-associated domain